jgi:hypothetical protein
MSVTLTNAEKQARYRERHLGSDGEKVRVGLNLNAGTRAKMGRLALHRGYTITALARRWSRCRTAGDDKAAVPRAQGLLRCRIDSEPIECSSGRRRPRSN